MNANRIRTYSGTIGREYIATQGPLPATVNDFWHMIQQELVKCIVMITREIEGLKVCLFFENHLFFSGHLIE